MLDGTWRIRVYIYISLHNDKHLTLKALPRVIARRLRLWCRDAVICYTELFHQFTIVYSP